jgi:hypothetical protein
VTALDASTTTEEATPQFVDRASSVRFELHTPYARPDLWQQYLDGAFATYREYNVQTALELEEIRSGLSTTLFVVGMSGSDVVAGGRFVGPILHPRAAHIYSEFRGSEGERRVEQALIRRIPEGVIEFKGCWAQIGHARHRALSSALSRSVVHAMRWLNVRYGCCSAAVHAARRWESSGGRVMAGVGPIPYPNPDYQTMLLWWDADRIGRTADPDQWALIQQEQIDWTLTYDPFQQAV